MGQCAVCGQDAGRFSELHPSCAQRALEIRVREAEQAAARTPLPAAMGLRGVGDMTPEQIRFEVRAGARFVVFQYCISVILVTHKGSSSIYFLRPGQPAFLRGLPFSLCSLLLGWWGVPWGPILTIATVVKNTWGGKDVTADVLRAMPVAAE